MNLQVVVIAHGNGIAAFNRHEKFWEAHKAPILVVCPENDPVKCKHEVVKLYEAHAEPAKLAGTLGLVTVKVIVPVPISADKSGVAPLPS